MPLPLLLLIVLVLIIGILGYRVSRVNAARRAQEKRRNQFHDRV